MEIHEGHRQRMYEKLKNSGNLYEHEVLEILLYNAYPRKDTNPIAHALLQRFPSITAVLKAEVDELITVEGVGRQTALYLKCIGRCFEFFNSPDNFGIIKTRADLYNFACMRLSGHDVEIFELYAVDKNGKVIRILTFTTDDRKKVEVPPDEVMRFITLVKPHSIVAAHNHVGVSSQPSAADDDCTKQIQLACSINNVILYDHVIYSDKGKPFSYYKSGRLNAIKDDFSIGNLLKDVKTQKTET